MGVLSKPISDRLLWIEAALFLRLDQRDERLRVVRLELLLQIKNARWIADKRGGMSGATCRSIASTYFLKMVKLSTINGSHQHASSRSL
jgi:hypothetical protein